MRKFLYICLFIAPLVLLAEKRHFLQATLDLGIGGFTFAGYSGNLEKPAPIKTTSFAAKTEVLYAYQIYAVELASSLALVKKGAVNVSGTYKSENFSRSLTMDDGIFTSQELRLGFKLLQRKKDMGFLFVFAGPVFYSTPKIGDITVIGTGTNQTTIVSSNPKPGLGYTFGFRDMSTWDFKKWSLIHTVSMRVVWAPLLGIESIQSGPAREEFSLQERGGIAIHYELAAGVALEDYEVSALLGYEWTSYYSIDNNDTGIGFHVGRVFLRGTKQLWF
ncbi:MAG: hypothetical protein D6767_09030 [Candidatus Hydrogenedentota bacterium]|nr:MAG: hypothetical protein D6767_09030 [Candidatus Hydrogenedentota bacterium]